MNILRKILAAIGVIAKYVPSTVQVNARRLVQLAATKFLDNDQRREWAVAELVKAHVPESLARFAVEEAVQWLKRSGS